MSFFKPWGYDEKNRYPFKKAKIISIFSSLILVYIVSEYIKNIFGSQARECVRRLLGEEVVALFAENTWLSQLLSFIITFCIFYTIIYFIFYKKHNPYFKHVSIVWVLYSLLSIKDSWLSMVFGDGTIKNPMPLGGYVTATAVLLTPVLMAMIIDYYYTHGKEEKYGIYISPYEELKKKITKIFAILLFFDFILLSFHKQHPFIFSLWVVVTLCLGLFLLTLVIDNFLSKGETFRIIFGDKNDKEIIRRA